MIINAGYRTTALDTPVQERYISIREAAARFGVCVETVRRWIQRDEKPLRAYKFGRRYFTTNADLEAFTTPKPVNAPPTGTP